MVMMDENKAANTLIDVLNIYHELTKLAFSTLQIIHNTIDEEDNEAIKGLIRKVNDISIEKIKQIDALASLAQLDIKKIVIH